MRVPWTARRSNQLILKEINPEYSLEGLILKPPDAKSQLIGKDMLGKTEGKRRRGCQKMSWLDFITNLMDMNLSKLWEVVKDRVAWHATVHVATKGRTQLSD